MATTVNLSRQLKIWVSVFSPPPSQFLAGYKFLEQLVEFLTLD